MTNVLDVIPDFDLRSFSHIIPPLERASISTVDLLTVDALDIAKRAQVPTAEVTKLVKVISDSLHLEQDVLRSIADSHHLGKQSHLTISTLDDELDLALNGGIHTSYLTEVAGESAAGKTQLLLTLLLSVQLEAPLGLSKNALYISTEAQLSTKRLAQILEHNPKLASNAGRSPSLNNVQSTHVRDLESQEHVLRYQVPVIIKRHNIGLVVIDSIAANYRAEFEKGKSQRAAESIAKRSLQIARLGAHLRDMARTHNIAIVVANQVADRFDTRGSIAGLSQSTQRSVLANPASIDHMPLPIDAAEVTVEHLIMPSSDDPLSLGHQQRFFTGWGDDLNVSSFKNPSLGLTWTSQLATRIVLLKQPAHLREGELEAGEKTAASGWHRSLKVVFSAWCCPSRNDYEIWQGGLRSSLRRRADEPSLQL